MSRRIVALSAWVVCILLLCTLLFLSKQVGVQYVKDGYIYYDSSSVSALGDSQSAEFSKFSPSFPEAADLSAKDFILE